MDYSYELNLVMKEIAFTYSKTLRSDSGRGYSVILGKYCGNDVVLRTTPASDTAKVTRFKREFEASKILALFNRDSESGMINFTEIVDMQKSKNLYWSIRSYSKDQTLAIDERYHQSMLHGYDVIRQKFIGNYQPVIENIIKTVKLVQKIDINIIKESNKSSLFTPRLEKDLEKIDLKKIERLLKIKTDKLVNFYNNNIKEYYDENNIRAIMGDLIPPNIIVGQDNQIMLYDYEWFCYDNYIVDYSSLWLFLWRYPKWQNAINKAILTTEKDKIFFRLSLIRELISWYAGAFSINETKKLKRRINFYQMHIWLEYLKAVSESFESIMKVGTKV